MKINKEIEKGIIAKIDIIKGKIQKEKIDQKEIRDASDPKNWNFDRNMGWVSASIGRENILKLDLLKLNLELELHQLKDNYFNHQMVSRETFSMLSDSLKNTIKTVKDLIGNQ